MIRSLSTNMDYRNMLTAMWVLINIPSLQAPRVIGTSLGTSITLRCRVTTVESDAVESFYWRKDRTTIYSATWNGAKNSDKYSVADGTSLVVPEVVDSDKGNYSCKVVRRSLTTEESDITQLYVLDLSVSHCDSSHQGADGCNCYVVDANITSLSCSARGFPNPPDITWAWSEADGEHTIRTSSLALSRFHGNVTLVCRAQERDDVAANRTVCLQYMQDISPTEEFPEETSRKAKAKGTGLLVTTILSILIALLLIIWLTYKRYTIKGCFGRDRTKLPWSLTPKTSNIHASAINSSGYDGGSMDVIKDSRKNSRANSTADVFMITPEEQQSCLEDVDCSSTNYNEGIPKKSLTSNIHASAMNSSGYDSGNMDVLNDSRKNGEHSIYQADDVEIHVGGEIHEQLVFIILLLANFQYIQPKTSLTSNIHAPAMDSSGYDGGNMDVIKDSRKNSRANSTSDVSMVTPEEQQSCLEDVDCSSKNYNEGIVLEVSKPPSYEEEPLPVAHVLLNDLRSSTAESKDSIKAAILALLEKRVEPYKTHQQPVESGAAINSSLIDREQSMQWSVMADSSEEDDVAFVDLVRLELDQILDEADRDECEILITKPDFHEISDENEIPAYQGCRDISQSLPLHPGNMSLSMASSSTAKYMPLSTIIRTELLKRTTERTAIRNTISQIILDSLKTGKRAKTNHPATLMNYSTDYVLQNQRANVSVHAQTDVTDEVSQLVALWTSLNVLRLIRKQKAVK